MRKLVRFMRVLGLAILLLTGCATGGLATKWEIEPTASSENVSGSWTAKKSNDPFDPRLYSVVEGTSLTPAYGNSTPVIYVQTQTVYMNLGDPYNCNPRGNYLQFQWTFPNGGSYVEEAYAMTTDDRKYIYWPTSFLEWNKAGAEKSMIPILYQLNLASMLEVKMTDSCGDTSIARFDVSGTHQYKVKRIEPPLP